MRAFDYLFLLGVLFLPSLIYDLLLTYKFSKYVPDPIPAILTEKSAGFSAKPALCQTIDDYYFSLNFI